jgi:hypothetical protein
MTGSITTSVQILAAEHGTTSNINPVVNGLVALGILLLLLFITTRFNGDR